MAEVAAEAGITPGAIYRYFPSKEELAAGCLDESLKSLDEQWLAGPDPSGDAFAQFLELAARTVGVLDEPGAETMISCSVEALLSAARDREGAANQANRDDRARMTSRIMDWLTSAQQAGHIADTLNPEALAGALISLYFGLRLTKLADPQADVAGQWAQVVQLLVRSSGRLP